MLEMLALPYEFDALEPYIDAETMKVHYNGHYQTYTANANMILETIPNQQQLTNEQLFCHENQWLRHNFGGWWNHTFFFDGLAPHVPYNEISTTNLLYAEYPTIREWFREQINLANIYASGYIWLMVYPNASNHHFLYVHYTADQKRPIFSNYWPLLNIDMWEHAYYLKNQNRKMEYLDNIFLVINWEKVNQRLENFIKMREMKDARYEPA